MGAKLKSKTHLQNTFFAFRAVFCAFCFKVCKKCYYDPKQIFCEKKSKKISKNAEFHADFESVEKVVKNAPKKGYKQNKFEKSEKVHISVTFCL